MAIGSRAASSLRRCRYGGGPEQLQRRKRAPVADKECFAGLIYIRAIMSTNARDGGRTMQIIVKRFAGGSCQIAAANRSKAALASHHGQKHYEH